MQIEALYQDIILDHYRNPRGVGLLDEPAASAYHVNPTCGDEITVQVTTNPDGTVHIGYEGQGCSISQASASVMSELANDMPGSECDRLHGEFLELMHSRGAGEPDEESLGDAVAFVGVSKYPARIKCALLPWMALHDARHQLEEA
jgi:nitrogen fixation NifU-like protein